MFVDGLVDGSLVVFAIWTIWYEIALVWQFDLRPSGWAWAIGAVVSVLSWARYRSRPLPAAGAALSLRRPVSQVGDVLALVISAIALVAAVQMRHRYGVGPVGVVGLGVLIVQLLPWTRRHAPRRAESVEEVTPRAHALTALVALGFAVLASLLVRVDADDVFYLNRSAWVATHGTPTLRDTMFGPGLLPQAFGAGLPTTSVESLDGLVASLAHVPAATVAYVISVPVLAALAVWSTWRLVRTWAPRRHVLVLAGSLVFLLASSASVVGNYSIGRIWQGKVIAYAILMPLVWHYLAKLARRSSRYDVMMLLASGVAFVGLTTTSALVAPVIGAAGLLAAAVLSSRAVALGAVAFVVAPVVNGLVQLSGSATIGNAGGMLTAGQTFVLAYGAITPMVLLALAGTMLAVRLVPGPAGVVAICASGASVVAFVPGVLRAADSLTSAGAIVWRLAIVSPTWVLVGLLLAMPWPSRQLGGVALPPALRPVPRLVTAAVWALVLLIPIASGRWITSHEAGARMTSMPVWKVDPVALADVRAAERLDVRSGLWLMPPAQMQILAISAAGPFAVVPRDFYLSTLPVPRAQKRDRYLLLRLERPSAKGPPSVEDARRALDRLGVALACVPGSDPKAQQVLSAAVGGPLRAVGTMRCHIRTT